ncbi:TerB family tellurite resistance protein [Muricauda sp. SCSIO 64092]|uniref:TerB family tellurite resistance protein n=1 Tax=Allomuricauda sp. SCSIO 64092 TaxID=2908842 RepID=UPI001FF6AF1D|nr:TerB family tellurite resistance protein [Muricauda sp. SCSIO 64092]UOY05607.1 TerB family tellurite resistance protein [Muricauda sp. SCSIO 64092]
MNSYQEKLSILSELIAFARVDYKMKDDEYDFLLSVANLMEVKKSSLDDLLKNKTEISIPRTQTDRIVQFHRLLLMMNIDNEQHKKEIEKLHNIGLWMGLPPSAISQVLEVMHQYPNKAVPPKVLLDIFRAHYN